MGACEIAELYKTGVDPSVRIAAMITDYQCEPAWVQKGVETFFVPNERVAEQLRQSGAAAARIEVVGIVVRKEFHRTQPKARARIQCDLSPDLPTILMMAGGMGPSRLDLVISELDKHSARSTQVVVIAGRDKALLKRIRKLKPKRLDLHAVGWTDKIHIYMSTADVLITKPGGVTLTEALFSSNQTPLIAFDPLPGPEEENACEIVRRGAGWSISNPEEAAVIALRVLSGEARVRTGPGANSASDRIVLCLQTGVTCV